MSKAWLRFGGSAAFALLACTAAWGHGGNYKGPSDTVPPNLGGGGDTTPPGNPGGPGTPGPGAPTTGGSKGPVTGGAPTAPTGGAGAGMRGGAGAGSTRRGGASEGFERWEFWWEHNKDPFLDLKARLAKGAVRSGTGGFLIGRSAPGEAVAANRPSPSDVKNLLLPAFIEGLGESHPDIADSSALAIGRTLNAQDAATALDALKKALGHSEKSAREAATLAMGVLGSVDGVEVLRSILNDTQDGRRLTNHPQGVEDLVRSFAAASLGLIGDPKAIEDLKKVVNDANLSAKLGVKAMSILALGMMRENHEDIVKFLLGLMDDRALNNIVKAQAPIALGRLNRMEGGSPAARQVLSPKILPLFQDDKTDNDLRRSLAICIGMLATVENAEAIEALMNAVAKSSDEQTRHFSIMALSEIGARDGDPAKHAEVHATLKEFFLRELIQPKRITHQPYGALGLAVYARNEKLGAEVKTEAATKLLDQFNSVSNPSYQGAMAVGLGLLESKIASEDLWKKFEDSNDQPLKGYIAIALGLMRENARAEALRAKITQKGLDQKFRLQLARSLGLMSDTQAVPTLIEYLQSAETLAESSSAAQALGLIGDKSAVQPLLEINRNKSKQPLKRGFAAVALGIIAEKTALPWNAVFSVDSNYRAKVDALSEILDIL